MIEINNNEILLIDEQYLSEFWKDLTNNSRSIDCNFSKRYFFEYFKNSLDKEKNDSFEFNTKGWKVKIAEGIAKSIINGASVYGLLHYLGVFDGMSTILVPLLIPILVDIENVKLSKSEEEVYLSLPINNFKNSYKTNREWYEAIPTEIQKDFTWLNFVDLLDKLYDGGLAEREEKKFKIYSKDENKFRITY